MGKRGKARLHPQQAVAQAAVLRLHALGPPGGAGGEDDIGQGIRRDAAPRCRPGGRQPAHVRREHVRCEPVRRKHAPAAPLERGREAGVADDHGRSEVFEHGAQARFGQARRNGHVDGPHAQHREDAGHHFQRPFEADAGVAARRHPLPGQPGGHVRDPGVELRIGAGPPGGVDDGDVTGRARQLFAEQAVRVPFDVEGFRRVVEAAQQFPFALRHQVQRVQGDASGRAVAAQHRLQQGGQAFAQVARGGGGEQVRPVFQMHLVGIGLRLAEIEAEVELAVAVRQRQGPHVQGTLVKVVPGGVFQRHEHVEQRRARGVPLHAQRLDKLLERARLRGKCTPQRHIHGTYQFIKGGIRLQCHADGQRVDEQANHALGMRLFAVGGGAPHDQVVLPGVPVQEGAHQRQQHREQRRARIARAGLQRPPAFHVQPEHLHPARKPQHGGPGKVARQAQPFRQGQQRGLQFVQPDGFAAPFPGHMAEVVRVQRRPRRGRAAQHRSVGLVQFTQQDFRRPAVEDDVVGAEQQRAAGCALAEQRHPHQRRIEPEVHGRKFQILRRAGAVALFQLQAAERRKALFRRIGGNPQP